MFEYRAILFSVFDIHIFKNKIFKRDILRRVITK